MNAPTTRETLRFAGGRAEKPNESNPWPQPSVISRSVPSLGTLMGTKEHLDFRHNAIACVAYHRWQAHGSPDGEADENWLAAEIELMTGHGSI